MMRSRLWLLALVCALAAAAPLASAEKPTLDSLVEVRFEATAVADVFRQIVTGLGYELHVDRSVGGPVTLWVSGVSARTVLNVVCESVGCTWQVTGNRLVVTAKPEGQAGVVDAIAIERKEKAETAKTDLQQRFRRPLPVDMRFQDVPVSTILRALSDVSGLEITADEPLASQRITLIGSGKTVEDALGAIVGQAAGAVASFTISGHFGAGGSTMRIALKARLAAPKKQ